MNDWPQELFPIQGCRILFNPETKKPYSMPIRPLPSIGDSGVSDPDNARAWFEFAWNNYALSKSEKIAYIQRSVMLEPRHDGWWYTLGCHYELEGQDWYGGTNAFNHVVFLNPNHEAAWYSLANLWSHRGYSGKAKECYDRFDLLYTKRTGERPSGTPGSQ